MPKRCVWNRFGCLIFSLCFVAVIWWGVLSHDWNLYRLQWNFNQFHHLSGTKLLLKKKELGLLIGNSNHIDYFVGEVRRYNGNRAKILEFYKNKTIWNPISHDRYDVQVVFLDDLKKSDEDLGIPDPVFDMADSMRKKTQGRLLYIVYVFDAGYRCRLDIRGC